VADSSVAHDRNRKRILYARAGMPDYWIMDLTRKELLVFRDPQGGDFAASQTLRRGGSIAPLAFPDVPIAVDDLLGEPPIG
jgi:Uma2 family endonuclease